MLKCIRTLNHILIYLEDAKSSSDTLTNIKLEN